MMTTKPMKAYLSRFETSDNGTFGSFSIPKIGYESFTAEPPWKDNKNRISCIPEGNYIVIPRKSPKYGWCFHVTNVHGREWILNHSGNYAGDPSKGLNTHTLGCILHGKSIGYINGQRAVVNSRIAISDLIRKTNMKSFELKIKWL